ncbi:succinate--CoA ligase subunit alpha [Desulfoplanes formicivorans]|uniref:Succinyl-CoA synthetase subunit beta n=1 Tax=Desulfoplanes formicivorans TaxID=1592317 RepID=A0A194AJN0_9BACT|nr:succinate--CoA ligase subunit alpha [Desulfoplanes formicivorans]GAU09261.1 succinyl-CoA synthetase subunit beta [Desulfoplanes formicivorans]
MKLDEHTSKQLFAQVGIPVPRGHALTTITGNEDHITAIGFPMVVKAQVLTGGRGKAGGVRLVKDMQELEQVLPVILSMRIRDLAVPYVRIEPAASIKKEYYLSVFVQRETRSLVLACNACGGVDVEASSRDTLMTASIDFLTSSYEHRIQDAFFHLGLPRTTWSTFHALCTSLINLVTTHGALLAEINPLALTDQGTLVALDGKVDLDDSKMALLPEVKKALSRPEHQSPDEIRARTAGLSYHRLKGSVGMMVNGAGLAMNTMDILNKNGLEPANFLDLGGGADIPRMRTGLELLVEDDRVKVIFINIFGGILSCAHVAEALTATLDKVELTKPCVVRFSGYMADDGQKILKALNHPRLCLVENMESALAELAGIIHPSAARKNVAEPTTISMPDQVVQPDGRVSLHPSGPLSALNRETQVLVQGITGKTGRLHTGLMRSFGTRVVAGVTPFKGGTRVDDIPVYDTVRQACAHHDIGATVIFVPPAFAPDAILAAAAENIPWIICITESIPQADMLRVLHAMSSSTSRLIGPNTPGLVIPDEIKLGIMPGMIFKPGPVAVFSRSGTLTYETVYGLTRAGIGQSICVGIGGDPFIGSGLTDMLELIRNDGTTRGVVVLGEIGGNEEEKLAAYIRSTGFDLPVVGFIAGQTAPPGKTFGHAGAILSKGHGEIDAKLTAMRDAGIFVASSLEDGVEHIAKLLG